MVWVKVYIPTPTGRSRNYAALALPALVIVSLLNTACKYTFVYSQNVICPIHMLFSRCDDNVQPLHEYLGNLTAKLLHSV